VGTFPFGAAPGLFLQAATPVAGVALVNGTPTILSWTPPNDGKLHRFTYFASMVVTAPETGGTVGFQFDAPGNVFASWNIFAPNQGAGYSFGQTVLQGQVCAPGQPVTLVQITALTAGAATLWAEIWGS
jgi:hypothetical protein